MNYSKKRSSGTLLYDIGGGKYIKGIGIRRIQYKDDDNNDITTTTTSTTNNNNESMKYNYNSTKFKNSYPHGIDNPIIQHLLLYHNDILSKVLFTKSPLDTYKEYVSKEWKLNTFSKLMNNTDTTTEDGEEKIIPTTNADDHNTTITTNTSTTSRGKVLPASTASRGKVLPHINEINATSDANNLLNKKDDSNDDNNDKDDEDDMLFFLIDVIEEKNIRGWRANDTIHFYDDEFEYQPPNECIEKSNSKNKYTNEELVWLTKEMERDWKEFLDDQDFELYINSIRTTTNAVTTTAGGEYSKLKNETMYGSDNHHEILNDTTTTHHPSDYKNENKNDSITKTNELKQLYSISKKTTSQQQQQTPKYKYKASITMVSHGTRCDLGTYDAIVDAAKEYDKFALGRKTLGRKLLEEYDIRRRVYARRASYLQTKDILLNDDDQDHEAEEGTRVPIAASKGTMAAGEVLSILKPEGFLITDRVLNPELNFFNDDDYNTANFISYPSLSSTQKESSSATTTTTTTTNSNTKLKDQQNNNNKNNLEDDSNIPIGKRLRRTFDTITNDMLYNEKQPQISLTRILNEIDRNDVRENRIYKVGNISEDDKFYIQHYLSSYQEHGLESITNEDNTTTTTSNNKTISIKDKIEQLTKELNKTTNDIKISADEMIRLMQLEKEYNVIKSKEKDRQKSINNIYKFLNVNKTFSSPWKQSFSV